MYTCAPTTGTQRSVPADQTLGNVCAPHVCILLQSTNSCRDVDSWHLSSPLKSPWASLSVPYQRMEGPRPHREGDTANARH